MKILLVDDDPVIRLLASTALEQREGFTVVCASSGKEALELAHREPFDLVLLDQLMPDMAGSEVLENLREDPQTRLQPVVFFTAKTNTEQVESLRALGVTDMIAKPFDPNAVADRVVDILRGCGRLPTVQQATAGTKTSAARKRVAEAKASDSSTSGSVKKAPARNKSAARRTQPDSKKSQSVTSLTEGLMEDFLSTGRSESTALLSMLDSTPDFDREGARRIAHRWVGRGGTFGYPTISQAAQRIEALIRTFPEGKAQLRQYVESMHQVFQEGPAAESHDVSRSGADNLSLRPATAVTTAVRAFLGGKRIALVGFGEGEVSRVAALLDATGAFTRPVDPGGQQLSADQLAHYDLLLVRLGLHHDADRHWLASGHKQPVLLVGPVGSIGVDSQFGSRADFSIWPVNPEELLMRAHRLLSLSRPLQVERAEDNRSIVLADDDCTVTALLQQTLSSYEFDCHVAESGSDALELASRLHPAAIILDVNMPGMSGFEVLSRLKSTKATRPIAVIMVTSRNQEVDVLRGFSLGADDYVAKPFNPIELVARLKRILSQSQLSLSA